MTHATDEVPPEVEAFADDFREAIADVDEPLSTTRRSRTACSLAQS
jgi:hypothetical protein